MWPWGHLAIAYLCYVAYARATGRPQRALPAIAVAFGSQFPDLIDKPLAWTVTVLPSGRSLAHSLFTAAVVLLVADRVSQRFKRRDATVAFAIGYLTHTVSDLGPTVISGLLVGDWSQLQWTTYLVWPLLPSPPYPSDSSFVAHFAALSLDPFLTAQFLLFGVATAVWLGSGAPGARATYAVVRWRRLDTP